VPVLFAATFADLVICPTETQKAEFPRVLQPRIAVLHPGVDSDVFASRSPSGGAALSDRAELIVAPAPAGGDRAEELFSSLAHLLDARPGARAAVVVGSGRVEEVAAVRRLAAAIDATRCAVLVRPDEEARRRLLGAASVLVRAGVRGPVEDLVLEAMAAGVLVAGFASPALGELVRHGAEGYLSAAEPAALAALAGSVLDQSSDLDALRERARRAVRERYHRPVQLARLIGLLRWVHAGGTRPVRPEDYVPYRRATNAGGGLTPQ
jgi:glycosyltransferase involved in cell wall biosynthesis